MADPSERADGAGADARLAASLEALASPVRLALLGALRTPKTVTEIRLVAPAGQDPDLQRARPLARQTIKEHLDRLVDVGAVVARPTRRDFGDTTEYVVSHQALFALAEEFRALARLRPTADPGGSTVDRTAGPEGASPARPVLILVKGLDEGRTFPLASPGRRPRVWSIGRNPGQDVALDYDPFVSGRHARLAFDGERYSVQDLGSRNGTALNFRALGHDAAAPAQDGDVIGIGRSILLLRA